MQIFKRRRVQIIKCKIQIVFIIENYIEKYVSENNFIIFYTFTSEPVHIQIWKKVPSLKIQLANFCCNFLVVLLCISKGKGDIGQIKPFA